MNDFSDLLRHDTVLAGVSAANKKLLFQTIASAAARVAEQDAKTLADVLIEREKLGSTGFGGGIAIPHGKVPGLKQIVGVFVRLAQPVDFQAVDDMPVDLVFAMFSPADAGSAHLKALARVSRRLRDKGFVTKLRGAGSHDAIWALLTQDEARDAA
jgi:PTS system nitrogen regulatory IIA component